MDRFFVNPSALADDKVVFSDEQAHQIRSVLRKKAGNKVIVLDNTGLEYEVELAEVTHGEVTGIVLDKKKADGEPQAELTIYQSLLTRQKFEWVLQKCTEIGVCRFVPVVCRRSLVQSSKTIKPAKMNRWQKILKESAEQCARGCIPKLLNPKTFKDAVEHTDRYDCKLIAVAGGKGRDLRQVVRRFDEITKAAIFIGPEGGFTTDEIDTAKQAGFETVTFGKRVLRTETAAIVSSALFLYELGQTNTKKS